MTRAVAFVQKLVHLDVRISDLAKLLAGCAAWFGAQFCADPAQANNKFGPSRVCELIAVETHSMVHTSFELWRCLLGARKRPILAHDEAKAMKIGDDAGREQFGGHVN